MRINRCLPYLLLLVTPGFFSCKEAARPKPNILFILADRASAGGFSGAGTPLFVPT